MLLQGKKSDEHSKSTRGITVEIKDTLKKVNKETRNRTGMAVLD